MLIYEPRGKAREYSPLALNVYSGGCDHGCKYCYCRLISRGAGWGTTPRPRNLAGLEREAERAGRQILMCFMGDPYCAAERQYRQTRKALAALGSKACSVAILTKGGTRCLDDLDAFRAWPDGRIKVGATLTFISGSRAAEVEPGAASPADRIEALKQLHDAGVPTWASIEPVIDPDESLAAIRASLPFVDQFKVGKLNHEDSRTDWSRFGLEAVEILRAAGKRLYVKADLRPHLPAGFLSETEADRDAMALPDRPVSRRLASQLF